jgi:arsenite methyltransferase
VKEIGFGEVRRVSSRVVDLSDSPEMKEKCGDIQFASMTVRLFKIPGLTAVNEDHGETAKYLGGIQDKENHFQFDEFYGFPKGEVISVCSNTAEILRKSRFAQYFEVSEAGELIGNHAIQTQAGDFIPST